MALKDQLARHQAATPKVHPTAFVAPGAVVLGDVTLGAHSSVWYQCTLRGDIHRIVIGPRSNIQDNSVVHLADDYGCCVGELVTVGHRAILHACTVADEVLVGMGAIILDGAEIGPRSIIGAGALVTMHTRVPEGSLVLGMPARVVRKLPADERAAIKTWALKYVEVARRFLDHPPVVAPAPTPVSRRAPRRSRRPAGAVR